MASTFILKRKTFSEKTESNWGKRLAAVGGTLATAGGAFYGAKKGVFGNTARQMAGKAWANAGKAIGSESMMMSGVTDFGKGRVGAVVDRAAKRAAAQGRTATKFTEDQLKQKADQYGYQYLNKLMK